MDDEMRQVMREARTMVSKNRQGELLALMPELYISMMRVMLQAGYQDDAIEALYDLMCKQHHVRMLEFLRELIELNPSLAEKGQPLHDLPDDPDKIEAFILKANQQTMLRDTIIQVAQNLSKN